tara:strand:- start:2317 stop:2856 length:540 start_codon:yes stop_codon:yes gene_type:complete
MKSQVIAKVYAKSIMELAGSDIDAAKELTDFNLLINECNDLENVLFSEVFTMDEKQDVLSLILKKLKLSDLTNKFLTFLFNEKRFNLFPLIYKEIIVLDDDRKGFLRGVIEGAEDSIDSSVLKKIKTYLKSKLEKETELEYKRNENLSAGYRMTVDDLQLDASLENQLENFKNSVLSFE